MSRDICILSVMAYVFLAFMFGGAHKEDGNGHVDSVLFGVCWPIAAVIHAFRNVRK